MERVVSEISLRGKRHQVNVVGYSKSDRGTKFVNGLIEVSTMGKSKKEVDAEIAAAIDRLLVNQSSGAQGRMDLPGLGD